MTDVESHSAVTHRECLVDRNIYIFLHLLCALSESLGACLCLWPNGTAVIGTKWVFNLHFMALNK